VIDFSLEAVTCWSILRPFWYFLT